MRKGGKMKVKIERTLLLKELDLMNGIVEKRSTMPILNYILLKSKEGGKIEISGTDLEIGIVIEINAEIERDGSITVAFSLLYNLIKEMETEYIEIEEKEDSVVELRGGNSFYTLYGLSPDNFPTIPLPENEEKVIIDIKIFKKLIKMIKYAISEEHYTAMGGGYFIFKGKTIEAVSSDYNRLAYVKTEVGENFGEIDFLIYRKALNEILKFEDEGKIEVIKGVNNYFFVYGNRILTSRVIEKKFPEFYDYVNMEREKKVIFYREETNKALRRILNIISSKIKQVNMVIKEDKIILSYDSVDSGRGEEELRAEGYKGDDIIISFNAIFIKEFLENIESEKVIMEFSDEKTIVRFKPEDGVKEGDQKFDYTYMVIPFQ